VWRASEESRHLNTSYIEWVYQPTGATGGEPVVVQVLDAEVIAEKQWINAASRETSPSARKL